MIRLAIIGLKDWELKALGALLKAAGDIRVVGQGADGYDAIRLVRTQAPDIVLLDEDMPLVSVEAATKSIKRLSPKTRIVILVQSCENELVLRSIHNGAAGYLIKRSDYRWIHWFIRTVHRGYSLMSPEVAAKAYRMHTGDPGERDSKSPAALGKISRRELRVIALIGEGLSNKEIAESLNVKIGTIRNYLSSIYQKTGAKNRAQAAVFAHQAGLKVNRGKEGRS